MAGSLHGLTQQPSAWFFLDNIFAGRKVKIVKRKTHARAARKTGDDGRLEVFL